MSDDTQAAGTGPAAPPALTFEEARVFGCLIEKSQATPEYYPLTLNSLTTACNQKTSRDPVVDFDEDTVEEALESLRGKGLVAFASGVGRAVKYIHRAGQNGLGLSSAQACVVSLLLLRGAQTPGELRTRAGRQFSFADLESVQRVIDALADADRAMVEEAPRRPGQKEIRYRHRFFTYDPEADAAESAPLAVASAGERSELRRVVDELRQVTDELRTENAALRTAIDALSQRLAVLEDVIR